MLYDAGGPDRTRFDQAFDVCVIGAGPAGVTVARALAAQGYQVALMEAGDFDFSDQSQAFYKGDAIGVTSYPTDELRLRYFGGTSGHWEGKCRSLDATDFAVRPWMPLSGWPIGKAQLDPFAVEASAILDLSAASDPPDIKVEQKTDRYLSFDWRYSPPTRFGDKYRDELTAAERIAFCIKANLVDLRLSDDLSTVEAAVFRSYAGDDPGFTVKARIYALCLGGLENPRALLNCRSQVPVGIGNDNDVVGRYFCDRPTVFTGDLLSTVPLGEGARYIPTPAYAEAQKFSNFELSVEPRDVPQSSLAGAAEATAACMTPGINRLLDRVGRSRGVCYWGGFDEFIVRYKPDSYPVARIGMTVEQTLNPDSRVSVSEEKDAFGLNRIRVDWQLTDADYRTIRDATVAFGAHVAEMDSGRLRLRPWMLEEKLVMPNIDEGAGLVDGRQHMCSTRMSTDPKTGVVDADCRVHTVGNLFIGGSSVFATSGYARPTYTIVQLALRLGGHIGSLLSV